MNKGALLSFTFKQKLRSVSNLLSKSQKKIFQEIKQAELQCGTKAEERSQQQTITQEFYATT